MTTHEAVTRLWDEDISQDDLVTAYQALVDTGAAWKLEGHVGRTAMSLIEDGQVALGPTAHYDYWGNRVPSRDEVEPGTKGSVEYVRERSGREIT